MKKTVVGLILLAFLLQTCRDDDPVNTGNVQFTFSASSLGNAGGKTSSDLTDGAVLVISISKSNGDPIHTLQELTLLKFGDQFISSPLALPQGNYAITDFLVANADHEVLYATPKEDSPLASLVEHPLPIAFGVSENEITNLEVQVVSVNAHLAEEFGYVSFSINIVPTEAFKLSVFIPGENSTLEFSEAQAYILQGEDTIAAQYLSPTVNSILLDAPLTDSFTLVLIAPSYKKYSRTFTIDEFNIETQGNDYPLTVTLTPALTFTMTLMGTAVSDFDFLLSPALYYPGDAALNIDWGDGISEEVQYDSDGYGTGLAHTYSTPGGTFFISVSGDLELMERLNLSYSNISDISLRYLPELKEFAMSAAGTPPTVDLSHNPKLVWVNFLITQSLTSLDISNNTSIKQLMLLCNNDFTTESVDLVIHNILRNARDFGVTDGVLTIQMCTDSGANEPYFIGPPSSIGMEELRELRDTYGWLIYPQIDF